MSVHSILEAIRRREPWMASSACQHHDPDLWFPHRGQATTIAKQICDSCPVRTNCLQYGLDEKHGIWGGLSADERATYRKAIPVIIHTSAVTRPRHEQAARA